MSNFGQGGHLFHDPIQIVLCYMEYFERTRKTLQVMGAQQEEEEDQLVVPLNVTHSENFDLLQIQNLIVKLYMDTDLGTSVHLTFKVMYEHMHLRSYLYFKDDIYTTLTLHGMFLEDLTSGYFAPNMNKFIIKLGLPRCQHIKENPNLASAYPPAKICTEPSNEYEVKDESLDRSFGAHAPNFTIQRRNDYSQLQLAQPIMHVAEVLGNSEDKNENSNVAENRKEFEICSYRRSQTDQFFGNSVSGVLFNRYQSSSNTILPGPGVPFAYCKQEAEKDREEQKSEVPSPSEETDGNQDTSQIRAIPQSSGLKNGNDSRPFNDCPVPKKESQNSSPDNQQYNIKGHFSTESGKYLPFDDVAVRVANILERSGFGYGKAMKEKIIEYASQNNIKYDLEESAPKKQSFVCNTSGIPEVDQILRGNYRRTWSSCFRQYCKNKYGNENNYCKKNNDKHFPSDDQKSFEGKSGEQLLNKRFCHKTTQTTPNIEENDGSPPSSFKTSQKHGQDSHNRKDVDGASYGDDFYRKSNQSSYLEDEDYRSDNYQRKEATETRKVSQVGKNYKSITYYLDGSSINNDPADQLDYENISPGRRVPNQSRNYNSDADTGWESKSEQKHEDTEQCYETKDSKDPNEDSDDIVKTWSEFRRRMRFKPDTNKQSGPSSYYKRY